jgi:hypothetical protein
MGMMSHRATMPSPAVRPKSPTHRSVRAPGSSGITARILRNQCPGCPDLAPASFRNRCPDPSGISARVRPEYALRSSACRRASPPMGFLCRRADHGPGLLAVSSKALQIRPRLDRRSVQRELLRRKQLRGLCRAHDLLEQLLQHLVLDKTVTVLGERRRIPTRLIEAHVEEEPTQVIVEALAQLPVRPDR